MSMSGGHERKKSKVKENIQFPPADVILNQSSKESQSLESVLISDQRRTLKKLPVCDGWMKSGKEEAPAERLL